MIDWKGVFPAVTTRFTEEGSLDLDGTLQTYQQLIDDGVHGLIILGTCGENCSLSGAEKRNVMKAAKELVAGRVPLLSGVSEFTTQQSIDFCKDAEAIGLDGVMLLPAMVYVASEREVIQYYRSVAAETKLPIMVYNNPVSYRIDITVEMMAELVDIDNIVAIKEASEDPRRITDLINRYGDRFALFGGVDDVALESLMLGAVGWVSGLTSAFPEESVAIYHLASAGRYQEAVEIYRWFMPLLHLDTLPTLVQCIKLAEQLCGRGSEYVRAPRLLLEGQEREQVISIVDTALSNRPDLSRFNIS